MRSEVDATAPAVEPRSGSRLGRLAWLPAGVAAATAVVLVAVFSGAVQSTDTTLVVMGFDPDRAQLITGLLVAAIAAAAVTLLVDRIGFATLLGAFSLAALFVQTFVAETQNAVAATGLTGYFDPGGWMLTVLTLVVVGFVSAWAGATLAGAVRPELVAALVAVRDMVGARRPSRAMLLRPVSALLVIVLLAVTVPAFGDMVNLSPDALMLNGNHGPGLAPGNSIPDMSPIPGVFDTPSPEALGSSGPSTSEAPGESSGPRITARPGTKPWLAWKPSGIGHVTTVALPAPWIGGSKSTSEIDIYTPPGYDPQGSRLYPVMYEAPTGLTLWGKGTGVIQALDLLIDSGDIPASIFVFIDSVGPPDGDTQCADYYDGRQWFETYISKTVPDYVDQNYKTIRDPRARGIMGMSAGGFCAAMLTLRHPDVFSTSISFSGYFWVGAAGPSTATPFGSAAGVEAHSPALLAPVEAGTQRSRLFFVIIANITQDFYGLEASSFEKILSANGYKHLDVDSTYTHGWPQVRNETPGALEAWGAQLVLNGIW